MKNILKDGNGIQTPANVFFFYEIQNSIEFVNLFILHHPEIFVHTKIINA